MQKAACLDLGDLEDDISIPTSGRSSDNVLVEREWNEADHNEKIH